MTVAGKIITALGLSFVSYVGLNEIQGWRYSIRCHELSLYRRNWRLSELDFRYFRICRIA